MRTNIYIGMIVMVNVFFIVLTILQAFYVDNMFKVQKIIFSRNVNDAMYDALQYVNKNCLNYHKKNIQIDTTELNNNNQLRFLFKAINNDLRNTYIKHYLHDFMSDYYPSHFDTISKKEKVNINLKSDCISHNLHVIDSIVKTVLRSYQINIGFDFGIYSPHFDSYVLYSNKYTLDKLSMFGYVYNYSFLYENKHYPAYFVIYFPGLKGYLLEDNVYLIMVNVVLIIIIYMFYVFTLITAVRHIKLLKFKQNFTDNIPHEFKTPISTIALASEALRDKDILSNNNILDSYLTIISTENKRLEQMVDAILESKNSISELKIEKVDINMLIEDAICIVKVLLVEKTGEIILMKTDKPFIQLDKGKILIVIKNILESAIKYNNNKPFITINIMIKRNKMILSFQDNGIGIEKKEFPKLFDQFYRVSTGYVHNVKGFGLGLNYIKTILKLHRGKIKVESVLDQGSTFKVYLPLKQNLWKQKRGF